MKICNNCKKSIDDDALVCPYCGCVTKNSGTQKNVNNLDSNHKMQEPKKKKNIVLLVVLWIFFLPIMATIAIVKSKKIKMPVKVILIVLIWLICFGIANSNKENSNTVQDTTENVKEEAISEEKQTNDTTDQASLENDLAIITRDGHPTYYGSTAKAHEVWDDVEKGKIIFADSNNKYDDSTILSMGGYSQDEKNEVIREIGIYFTNMKEVPDVSLGQAVEIATDYLPQDIIDKWYEFRSSYELVPNDPEKDTYHVITYGLTDKGSDSYYSGEHKYSGSIDVIINGSNENVSSLVITFGTPRWMSSLSTNGYTKNDWDYNALEEENSSANQEEVRYHNDEGINQMIIDYNNIAEVPITKDMISKAAYDDHAIVTINGIWIELTDNSYGQFVDIKDEVQDDEPIYVVFRDFMKVLDTSLDDEVIAKGWEDLKTNKYQAYNYYDLGNIQISCWVENLNNESNRYTIKSTLKR